MSENGAKIPSTPAAVLLLIGGAFAFGGGMYLLAQLKRNDRWSLVMLIPWLYASFLLIAASICAISDNRYNKKLPPDSPDGDRQNRWGLVWTVGLSILCVSAIIGTAVLVLKSARDDAKQPVPNFRKK
jgi:hypothetical protein